MAARTHQAPLLAIALLAATLHGVGIVRSSLPAQDGLKFIRTARAFQSQPWIDVVRGSDQHPLFPALVALTEPVVAMVAGHGPDTWRVAAQLVAAAAAIGLLWPLHGWTRALFGPREADVAALGFVLLPPAMQIGHDTLSDSLALAAFLVTLRLGLAAFRSPSLAPAMGCGLAAGLGFLTRPEILVAPLAVVLAGAIRHRRAEHALFQRIPRLAGVAVTFLALVGSYALVKGEVSEKLALRSAAALGQSRARPRDSRPRGHGLPRGLDNPAWDFSPKEEAASPPVRPLRTIAADLAFQWAEGLGWILALFTVWGLVRDGVIRRRNAGELERADHDNLGRAITLGYVVLFATVLMRHERTMGYLSHRHVLTLVLLSLPWAAAAVVLCARRASALLRLTDRQASVAGGMILAAALAVSLSIQARPPHPSRWGFRAAGEWLAANASPGDAVLDTRGWAAFVSGLPGYDYWHVRQALTDRRLAFVVVSEDELTASSRRAATLRSMLAYAGEPAAVFPEHRGGREPGVRVFRFRQPESWEGLQP